MDAAELLQARAILHRRAELEMFYRMTVEEGAAFLAWRAATEFPLSGVRKSRQAPQEQR